MSRAFAAARGGVGLADGAAVAEHSPLPTLIVFDLDDCLWTPEMYTLSQKPSVPVEGDLGGGHGRGVVGVRCGARGETVRLYPGALQVLQELWAGRDGKWKGSKIAAASSSEEPSYSAACLEHLEVVPGVSMGTLFSYRAIGRTGELSSNKRTHFTKLHRESRVPYDEMIFFDDCNWGDHVATVAREFGVVGQRTPSGLTGEEWRACLASFAKARGRGST